MSHKNQELFFSLFLGKRTGRQIQILTKSGQMFYGEIKHCGSDYITIDHESKGELWYLRLENIEGFRFRVEAETPSQPSLSVPSD